MLGVFFFLPCTSAKLVNQNPSELKVWVVAVCSKKKVSHLWLELPNEAKNCSRNVKDKFNMEQPQTAKENGEVAIEKCYICLGPFEDQSVGSLEKCQHEFCLECIVQWSKNANTCPVDRTTFTVIHQRRRIGGAIQKKIKVTSPKRPEEEEYLVLAVICENCGRSDRRNRILVCSQCDSGFHMNCLRPAVSERPDGLWVCPDCELGMNQPDSLSAEVGISDSELEDILSEVGEITSSRLRPSTLNHSSPGSSRHSDRVQTRSNRDPTAPQAITRVPKYLLQPLPCKNAPTNENLPSASASTSEEQRKRRKIWGSFCDGMWCCLQWPQDGATFLLNFITKALSLMSNLSADNAAVLRFGQHCVYIFHLKHLRAVFFY